MIRLRLEPTEISFAALDHLEADTLAAFVGPARPLRGLGALVDWRLCGAVSRAILAGTFAPQGGEVLLLPGGGRLPVARVMCFGMADEEEATVLAAARRACEVLGWAGTRTLAVALPAARPEGPLLRAWIEASQGQGLGRQLILGEARALARALAAAAAEMGADVEVVAPVPRVEVADVEDAAASLPVRGPVVR